MRFLLVLLSLLGPALSSWPSSVVYGQVNKAESTLYVRTVEDHLEAAIVIAIDHNWHLYHKDLGDDPNAVGKPTKVRFLVDGESTEDVSWSEVWFPEPKVEVQSGLGPDGSDAKILEHEGTITLYAVGRPTTGIDLAALTVSISGLTCLSDGMCVPYDEVIEVAGEGSTKLWESFPEELLEQDAEEEDEGLLGHTQSKLYVRHGVSETRAVIVIDIEEHWHIYHEDPGDGNGFGEPTVLTLSGDHLRWGGLHWPKPYVLEQPGIGPKDKATGKYTDAWILAHEGKLVIKTSALLEEGKTPGEVSASIVGQACGSGPYGVCVPVEYTFESSGKGPDEYFAEPFPPYVAKDAVAVAAETDTHEEGDQEVPLWLFLFGAMTAGLFTLLMPCTYPMIPITISFFTKQADSREGKVLPLSLTYGAGIVLIFVLIGVVLGPPIIAFAVHWATNLLIGGMFVFFAMSLFGWIDLQPPRFLMNAAGKASMRGGFVGVFLMGVTLVVTSFTCTAPFVGSLLSVGATTGDRDVVRVAMGMAVFGLTMAIPFVLLSLLPGKVKQMPRSGEWMKTLKVTLGFVELAAALKFLSNFELALNWKVLPNHIFLGAWIAIFLGAGIYLFGVFARGQKVTMKRRFAGLLFLALSGYWALGLAGSTPLDWVSKAMIPPYGYLHEEEQHEVILDDFPAALAEARKRDKLLLINFTGFLCQNCRVMETTVFPAPEVTEELQGFIEVRMHYDHHVEELKDNSRELQLRLLKSIGAPMYVVMDPKTEKILNESGFTSEAGFLEFLRKREGA